MFRRDFLARMGAAAGVLLLPPAVRTASAAGTGLLPRYWLQIHAGGGWCPLTSFDPYPYPVRNFVAADIQEAGPFRWGPFLGTPAPIPEPFGGAVFGGQASTYPDPTGYFNTFFTKYQSRLMIVNGVDNGTGDHPMAMMYSLTGGLGETYPGYSALVAAVQEPSLPMAYCGNNTAGIIGASQANMANLQASAQPLLKMASPNVIVPAQTNAYLDPTSYNVILQSINNRIARLQTADTIPFRQQQLALMQVARADNNNTALINTLNTLFDSPVNPNQVAAQIDVVLACFKAGIAFAGEIDFPGAQLSAFFSGYDTHSDHDARMYPLLDMSYRLIDYLITQADAAGLPLNIIISTDFSRTPGYNGNAGTDHNPQASSYMFLGPDFPGGRVLGQTTINDYGYSGMPLDPMTLQPDAGGVSVTAAHIHASLRQLAGINASPLAQQFALTQPALPLFSA